MLNQLKEALRKFDFKSYEETLAKTQKEYEDVYSESMALRERISTLEAESKINFRELSDKYDSSIDKTQCVVTKMDEYNQKYRVELNAQMAGLR